MASFQLQSHIEKITAKYIRIQSKNIYPTLSMSSFYRLNKYPIFKEFTVLWWTNVIIWAMPTHPSPNPTLTLNLSYQLHFVGLGEG